MLYYDKLARNTLLNVLTWKTSKNLSVGIRLSCICISLLQIFKLVFCLSWVFNEQTRILSPKSTPDMYTDLLLYSFNPDLRFTIGLMVKVIILISKMSPLIKLVLNRQYHMVQKHMVNINYIVWSIWYESYHVTFIKNPTKFSKNQAPESTKRPWKMLKACFRMILFELDFYKLNI